MQIFHGKIITCDDNNAVHNYLVEDAGKIVYCGDKFPQAYKHCQDTISLDGRVLMPAMGDGHIHFSNWALFNSTFDVRRAKSFDDIAAVILEYAERNKRSKMLIGYGYTRHLIREGKLINRVDLDAIEKKRPVYLVSYDGHSAVANSSAIGLIPSEIRDLKGFQLDTGYIGGDAFYKATAYLASKINVLFLLRCLLKGLDKLAAYGVGAINTVEGVGYYRDMDVDMVRFLSRGVEPEIRISFQTTDLEKVLKRKMKRIGGCFACSLDGCFNGQSASLLEPYSNSENNFGTLHFSDQAITDFVIGVNRAGLQVQLHCVGDAAVTQAVNALEAALIEYPRLDHRHQLIHAVLIPDRVMEKISRLGILVSAQPAALDLSVEPYSFREEILGGRAAYHTPLRDMIDAGVLVNGSSDAPVNIPDPIEGIYAACNHYNGRQSVSIQEALRMYTYNVAYAAFDEEERGSLEKGKKADMVILNRDPLMMDAKDLLQLKVEKMYLAGEEYKEGKSIGQTLWSSIKSSIRT